MIPEVSKKKRQELLEPSHAVKPPPTEALGRSGVVRGHRTDRRTGTRANGTPRSLLRGALGLCRTTRTCRSYSLTSRRFGSATSASHAPRAMQPFTCLHIGEAQHLMASGAASISHVRVNKLNPCTYIKSTAPITRCAAKGPPLRVRVADVFLECVGRCSK